MSGKSLVILYQGFLSIRCLSRMQSSYYYYYPTEGCEAARSGHLDCIQAGICPVTLSHFPALLRGIERIVTSYERYVSLFIVFELFTVHMCLLYYVFLSISPQKLLGLTRNFYQSFLETCAIDSLISESKYDKLTKPWHFLSELSEFWYPKSVATVPNPPWSTCESISSILVFYVICSLFCGNAC